MGRPKALLEFRGRTFIENIVEAIDRSTLEHCVIVVGHQREEIECRVPARSIVFNPDYEKGMITSFQAGIRALPRDVSAVMLFLVDHPVVETSTIEALITRTGRNRIVLPTFEGKRGHPVLFSADVLEEILDLRPTQGANIVVRKDPSRVVELPVNTPGILVDVDTPEQYEMLVRGDSNDG